MSHFIFYKDTANNGDRFSRSSLAFLVAVSFQTGARLEGIRDMNDEDGGDIA